MQTLARTWLLCSLVACTKMDTDGVISISTTTPPDFIAARDDADGRWLAPTVVDPTTFTFVTTGPYRVTAGCEGEDGLAEVRQIARTLDDDTSIELGCLPPASAELVTTMVQAGAVSAGNYSHSSSDPNWDVVLNTSPGRHTVAAYDDARMLILRDIEISDEGSTIPPIDLDAGFDLVGGELTTNAMPDESVRALVLLSLGDTTVFVHDGDPAAARFVPDGELASGESQYVEISANRVDSSRFASSERGGGRAMTLPAPLTSATLTMTGPDLTAAWTASLSGSVFVMVTAFSPVTNQRWFQSLAASETYASALGATATLELESITDLPPTMLFDSTTPQTRFVSITADLGEGETEGVSASQAVN